MCSRFELKNVTEQISGRSRLQTYNDNSKNNNNIISPFMFGPN